MNWLVTHQRIVIRTLAWIGITAIVILTVVPAVDRPVTGAGQVLEHFSAYALVAGVFAIGYRLSLTWLMLLAFLFCGLTELMQIPLPTRHARISDFIIDLAGAWFGIGVVLFINERLNLHSADITFEEATGGADRNRSGSFKSQRDDRQVQVYIGGLFDVCEML